MKRKTIKKINNKADGLLVEWLKDIVDEDDKDKITKENYKSLLPKEKYILVKRTRYLSFYTHRWAKQNIKKLLRKGARLEDITLGDLVWILKKRNRQNTLSNIL